MTKSAPIAIKVKISDLKVREGKRIFSFTTKVMNLTKLFARTAGEVAEMTFDSTAIEDGSTWNSSWVAAGQPSDKKFKNIKKTQEELLELFTLAGLADFEGDRERLTASIEQMQSFVD